jgi:hypothetical protein
MRIGVDGLGVVGRVGDLSQAIAVDADLVAEADAETGLLLGVEEAGWLVDTEDGVCVLDDVPKRFSHHGVSLLIYKTVPGRSRCRAVVGPRVGFENKRHNVKLEPEPRGQLGASFDHAWGQSCSDKFVEVVVTVVTNAGNDFIGEESGALGCSRRSAGA